MDMMLLDPFVRLLEDISSPQQVRAVEKGASAESMWQAVVESGFLNALAAEEKGGFGLSLNELAPLFQAIGAHAVPLPVAETMIARALLAIPVDEIVDGPIIVADLSEGHAGLVPLAASATHVLADRGDHLALFDKADLDVRYRQLHGSGSAAIHLADSRRALMTAPRPSAGLRGVAAIMRAMLIAGSAARVLDLTVAYANERVQFGRPIGKLQAVQHNLAVLSEKAVMAGMAARIGFAGGLAPSIEAAAIAKQVTSAAAVEIANLAHAVHGAIGISEEYDLQLLTRRLHEWRLAEGSEGYWGRILGARRLADDMALSVDYVRSLGLEKEGAAVR